MVTLAINLIKKHDTFLKYSLIGVTGVIIDFTLFSILIHYFGIFYQLANAISVSAGITNNFILNAFTNFKITDKFVSRYIKFYLIGVVGLILSAAGMFLLVEKLSVTVTVAKVIVIFIVALIQYTLNKKITFKV